MTEFDDVLSSNDDKLVSLGSGCSRASLKLQQSALGLHLRQYMLILRLKEIPNIIAMITLFWRKI